MTATERTLTVRANNALEVDPKAAKERTEWMMARARAGDPMFPKDLTPLQAADLANITLAYGLDPLLGEIMIYQGKPYVGIDGRERIANNDPQYEGMEVRPCTDEERKAFRCADDEHLWICQVWRKDRRFPFSNYGRAGGSGDRNPISKQNPAEMAMKRAKHRALRDAFSMPIPGREEIRDLSAARPVPDHGLVIDGEDREVIENPITAGQITAIHAMVGEIGWKDAEYRAVLTATFGVQTSKDLSEGQAAALTEMLAAIGDAEKSSTWRAQFDADLKAKGMNLRDLWDDGLPEDYGRSTPTVIAHEPSTVESTVIDAGPVESEPAAPEFTPCTAQQRAVIERLASPKALKETNWETLSTDDAGAWIESLQPPRSLI